MRRASHSYTPIAGSAHLSIGECTSAAASYLLSYLQLVMSLYTMSDENVDVELFIEEVKTRPVIWDVSHEDYKDRIKKQSAWENICEAIIENFSQKTENEKNATSKYNFLQLLLK